MKISFTLSRLSRLKRGSVWTLYLLLYELLSILPILNPQVTMENCIYGRIRDVYISFTIRVGRNLFRRHIIPMVRDILFEIFWICGVQLRCSSIVRPRKLNSVTLSIASELIASFKVKEFTLHWWQWKSIYFVFFTLRGSLFILSHSEMLSSSLFIFSDISSIFMSLTEAELLNEQRGLIKFVSSGYNIALELVLDSWISFI